MCITKLYIYHVFYIYYEAYLLVVINSMLRNGTKCKYSFYISWNKFSITYSWSRQVMNGHNLQMSQRLNVLVIRSDLNSNGYCLGLYWFYVRRNPIYLEHSSLWCFRYKTFYEMQEHELDYMLFYDH